MHTCFKVVSRLINWQHITGANLLAYMNRYLKSADQIKIVLIN